MMQRGMLLCWVGLLVLFLLHADLAEARGFVRRGRAGGGRSSGDQDRPEDKQLPKILQMVWFKNLGTAMGAAQERSIPVMAVLTSETSANDRKWVEGIGSWPNVIKLSQNGLAALKVALESDVGRALVKQFKIETPPCLVWMDGYGNPVLVSNMPSRESAISDIVSGWGGVMSKISAYFKAHLEQGDAYLQAGRFDLACSEYVLGAPYKGPEPEKMKEGLQKVRDCWRKMIETAALDQRNSRRSEVILAGLKHEVVEADYTTDLRELLFVLELELAFRRKAAASGEPARTADDSAKTDPNAVVAAPWSAQTTVIPPLSRVILSLTGSPRKMDQAPNVSLLKSSGDPQLAAIADDLVRAVEIYTKRDLPSVEQDKTSKKRILEEACIRFERVLGALEEAKKSGAKDLRIDTASEQTSMLLYDSLKLQGL